MQNVKCLNRENKCFVIIVLDESLILLLRISLCDEEFKTT